MNRGLQPVLDSIEFDGRPYCGDPTQSIQINGPDEIILGGCSHVVDATGFV